MKKFTTSAQKTLSLPKEVILKKLEKEMTKDTGVVFKMSEIENIKEARLPDGSTLIIASFDKDNGKTLAMIDHKNLTNTKARIQIQKKLREQLDRIFE